MVLKPCSAETAIEGGSSKLEDTTEPMEVSSIVVNSCLKKRKAEFDPEEAEEENDCENEEDGDGKAIIEEPEAKFDMLMAPEWDVDSFDGLEYYSSPDLDLSSDEQTDSDDEEAKEQYRLSKRQIIESKGFKVDPGLRPSHRFRGIRPQSFERVGGDGVTYRDYCEEMVHVCLRKHNQDEKSNVEFVELVRSYYGGGPRPKSYITFMAREKPDGPLVEYQAKAMCTLDAKKHPILCRPAPTPKP